MLIGIRIDRPIDQNRESRNQPTQQLIAFPRTYQINPIGKESLANDVQTLNNYMEKMNCDPDFTTYSQVKMGHSLKNKS